MLCECGKHEATIHEVIITKEKKKVERHLCEVCAREHGVSSDPYIPISQLISSASYIMGQVILEKTDGDDPDQGPADDQHTQHPSKSHAAGPVKPRPTMKTHVSPQACVGCGQTFSNFKKTGLLGCPACYQVFEERIGPMIERAHEGGCSHVGKVPHRALCESKGARDTRRIDALLGDVRQREERLESLRGRLAKSIHDEEYEQAAMLRDELTRLTSLAASQIEISPSGNPANHPANHPTNKCSLEHDLGRPASSSSGSSSGSSGPSSSNDR